MKPRSAQVRWGSILLFLLLLPLLLGIRGGEGETASIPWKDLALQFTNLFLYLILLYATAGKALRKFVLNRHNRIKQEIEDAAEAKRSAEERHGEIMEKLARQEDEFAELRAEVRKEAEEEKTRILTQAKKNAERIVAEAHRSVERETLQAQYEIRRFMVENAVELAERLLREKMTDKDQKKLIHDYLVTIEEQA
ncbi:MAG: hypothetical protein D6812_16115 [Deltaproteobacteria bacterium]|nr:MAG: hypothetical protein D6812_16115 [Deltaproteobacteria bacterium]